MTEALDWREVHIGRHHDRKTFDCGSPELNEYIDRYARQNHESGGAKTFVAVPSAERARVLGYYSISPGAIEFAHAHMSRPRLPGNSAGMKCRCFVSGVWRSA